MGEYAGFNGQRVKIGTCECMYYLRWEDRGRVEPLSGNVNPATDAGLFFRLPFPDEDEMQPGEYQDHNRGYRLGRREDEGQRSYWNDWKPDADDEHEPGQFQMHHKSGLIFCVPCHHGLKLPDLGPNIRPGWNGKEHSFELVHVKHVGGGVLVPVYRCRWCERMWSTLWAEILPFCGLDPQMQERLEAYAATAPQAAAA